MDYKFLSNEALITLEAYLERPSKGLINTPEDWRNPKQFYITIKKEDVKGNNEKIKNEIIIPACFELAGNINRLDAKYDTFFRFFPSENIQYNQSEMENRSLTVFKSWDIKENCDFIKIIVGVCHGERAIQKAISGEYTISCGACGSRRDIKGYYINKRKNSIPLCETCAKHARINGYILKTS